MKTLARLFILSISLLPLVMAGEDVGDAKSVPELTRLLGDYDAKSKSAVLLAHEAKVFDLNVKYIQALDRSLKQAQQEGKLEEALAIAAEKEAVSRGRVPPETEVKEEHRRLGGLRKTYLSTRERMEEERDRKLQPIRRDFLRSLDELRLKLTKEGRLNDALIVKNKRGEFEHQGAGNGEEDDDGASKDRMDRYFVNRIWISAARAFYSFKRGGAGERTHSGVTTSFTWEKRADGLVEVQGRMAPDGPPVKWYFKFDNRESALFGTRINFITAPLTSG